jgi:hypothetical protein
MMTIRMTRSDRRRALPAAAIGAKPNEQASCHCPGSARTWAETCGLKPDQVKAAKVDTARALAPEHGFVALRVAAFAWIVAFFGFVIADWRVFTRPRRKA